jgi:acyl-CoA hydrolase
MVVLMGQVVYVGNTSMQIRVNSFVEDKQGMRRLINTAYFTMIALDDNDRPTKAPGLIIENESEQAEYTAAKNRVALSKKELI